MHGLDESRLPVISPDTNRGLTEDDLDRIDSWAGCSGDRTHDNFPAVDQRIIAAVEGVIDWPDTGAALQESSSSPE